MRRILGFLTLALLLNILSAHAAGVPDTIAVSVSHAPTLAPAPPSSGVPNLPPAMPPQFMRLRRRRPTAFSRQATPAAVSRTEMLPSPPKITSLAEITTFPQKVRLEMANGNSYAGSVTAFDGTTYTVAILIGMLLVRRSDIKRLEWIDDPEKVL